MTEPSAPTRRQRLRAQTLDEIKEHALAQVAEGGPGALSLNAVARSMGMSGPAIYRYFASRDDLLTALVADSCDDLADTLQAAADAARRRAPEGRFRAVAGAYRDWALAQPHQYGLAFSTTYGSGLLDAGRTVPAAHRGMLILLDAVTAMGAVPAAAPKARSALDRELERWAADRDGGDDRPAALLHLGLVAWTRLHGLVSLEINGSFASMQLDGALLFAAELDQLVTQRLSPTGR